MNSRASVAVARESMFFFTTGGAGSSSGSAVAVSSEGEVSAMIVSGENVIESCFDLLPHPVRTIRRKAVRIKMYFII